MGVIGKTNRVSKSLPMMRRKVGGELLGYYRLGVVMLKRLGFDGKWEW